MNGTQEINLKYLRLIENAVENESDNIKNYVYFISDLAIKTRYTYTRDVINFVHFVNKNDSELELNDFTRYMSYIQYKEDGDETTSSYRIAVYSALRKYSTFLYSSGIIQRDYMQSIGRPKAIESQKTKNRRKISYLTEEEMKKYVKNVDEKKTQKLKKPTKRWSCRDRAIIKIFLTTGIRRSALVRMDLSDVNQKRKSICVTEKGGKVNEYYLTDYVMNELNNWLKYRNKMILEDTEALFVSSKSRKRMTTNAVYDVVKKYGTDIKHISPHKLRATYGTLLYEKTGDIHAVQKCMGHSSPTTTQIYIRTNEDAYKEKAKEIMESII